MGHTLSLWAKDRVIRIRGDELIAQVLGLSKIVRYGPSVQAVQEAVRVDILIA